MHIDLNKTLVISTGPKDIARSSLIRSVCEEAALKSKGYKIQNDIFDVDQLTDVNILIFANKNVSQVEYDNIITCANLCAIFVFGRNDDKLLHDMIPEAEQYFKWISICEYCHSDGHFNYEGNIVCRACQQDLRAKSNQKRKHKEIADSFPKTNKPKRRKLSFNSSSSSCEIIEPDNTTDVLPSMTTIINDTSTEEVINLLKSRASIILFSVQMKIRITRANTRQLFQGLFSISLENMQWHFRTIS